MEKRVTLDDLLKDSPANFAVQDTIIKGWTQIQRHEKIAVFVSGGADSDVMTDFFVRCGAKDKTTFVFSNTGLEYEATKRQLHFLEEKYGIKIEKIPPIKPIPLCVREYGVPFWSKRVSEMIMRLQRHNFQWEDGTLEELLEKYPRCRAALRWWTNDWKTDSGRPSQLNIEWVRGLKEFLMAHPPQFKISPKCCHYAKKEPGKKYEKTNDFDMVCVGVRKAEGGERATAHSTCLDKTFEGPDKYRPLFWWTNRDRADYAWHYGVTHSDCYAIWGMRRTGCAGCPFGDFEEELTLAEKYEPKFYRAMLKVFGQSYDYTRQFLEFRAKMKQKEADTWIT